MLIPLIEGTRAGLCALICRWIPAFLPRLTRKRGDAGSPGPRSWRSAAREKIEGHR